MNDRKQLIDVMGKIIKAVESGHQSYALEISKLMLEQLKDPMHPSDFKEEVKLCSNMDTIALINEWSNIKKGR